MMVFSFAVLAIDAEALAQVVRGALVAALLLLIPFMAAVLIWREWHPKIRRVRTDLRAYYRPSLQFMTWLTSAFLIGLLVVMGIFFIRVAFGLPGPNQPRGQPGWAYILTMVSNIVLLVMFTLPSTFLIVVKHRITDSDQGQDITRPH